MIRPESTYINRGLGRIALLAILFAFSLGCSAKSIPTNNLADATNQTTSSQSEDPAEPSFVDQLAAVRDGKSNSIRITARAIDSVQLEQLTAVADKLQELLLDRGVVTDNDCQWLSQLTALEHLRLRESPISDVGIERLVAGKLERLRIVNLPKCELTATGIKSLSKLPRLMQLRLGGPKIDDAAVAALASLPELSSLHLIGPKLTDHALEDLAKLPNLSSFYLDECPLSDKAWEKLFTARPTLHVHIDQAHHDRDPNRHE